MNRIKLMTLSFFILALLWLFPLGQPAKATSSHQESDPATLVARGDALLLEYPTIHTYPGSLSQAIKVAQHTNVTVVFGRTLNAETWTAAGGGGVLALLATGVVTMGGSISSEGRGLPGGAGG